MPVKVGAARPAKVSVEKFWGGFTAFSKGGAIILGDVAGEPFIEQR